MRFDTSLWEREHGKKPSGRRKWRFRIVSTRITLRDYEFVTETAVTFPAACKIAIKKARLRRSDQVVLLP
ncbi:hypothetical protein CQ12_39230 [Bradyrhizobium jicamae]|uniref:Integrase n=1 Tax=Bradyrhizobium jicamae TaxID=280332 RepID=A0A0R3KZV7_9BRAD|nr:hypothetical protein CQ12_39230 [Bradyrhizobium jicamae]